MIPGCGCRSFTIIIWYRGCMLMVGPQGFRGYCPQRWDTILRLRSSRLLWLLLNCHLFPEIISLFLVYFAKILWTISERLRDNHRTKVALKNTYRKCCMESVERPMISVSTEVSFLPIVLFGKLFSKQQAILDRQNTRQSKNQTLT